MTPVHVNIASDLTEGFSTHICIPPMPSPTMPSREWPVEQGWAAGRAKHKIAGTVYHRRRGIVQHGHDCGAGIPDQAPPYVDANAYLPIIMLKSSRKVMFGASTVKAEGTAVGGAHREPNLPMLSCGEPLPLPFTYPVANHTNTVLVGFTQADIDRGWEDIVDAILIEVVCFLMSIGNPIGGIGDFVAGVLGVDPMKSALGAAVGLRRSILRSAESGWTEPISIKVETGGGAVGGGAEVKWTPKSGEAEVSGEVGGFSEKRSAGAKRDADGNWTGTGAVPPDLFE